MVTKPPIIQLTQAGLDEIKTKHKQLTEKRKQVLVRLQTAREMGDLSENAAYHSAKFELGGIDRELRRLNHLLQFGKVAKSTGSQTISFGSTVTLKTGSQELTYTLVSQHESDPAKQKLSVDSPLGKLLLGKNKGDEVKLETPSSTTTYEIITIN